MSCEIGDFVKSHVCKLRTYDTSIARTTGLYDIMKDVYTYTSLSEGNEI